MKKTLLYIMLLLGTSWCAAAQGLWTAQLSIGYNYDKPSEHLGELQLYLGRSFFGDQLEIGTGGRIAGYPDWADITENAILGRRITSDSSSKDSAYIYNNFYWGIYLGYNLMSMSETLSKDIRLLISPTAGYGHIRKGFPKSQEGTTTWDALTYGARASLEFMLHNNFTLALQSQYLKHQTYSLSMAIGITFHW